MTRIDRAAFVEALRLRFPSAHARIDPKIEGGLLHLEMGAFHQHLLDAIRAGDPGEVSRCFAFADELLQRGTADVTNAVAVSLLEHLQFDGRRTAWAKRLLTPALARAWSDVHACMQTLRRELPERKQR